MKFGKVITCIMKYLTVILTLQIFIFENVTTQRADLTPGLPLPILKQGQNQGRLAVANSNSKPLTTNLNLNVTSGDNIANPNLGVGLKTNIFKSNVVRNAARGPGFLHNIADPSNDPTVKALLSHPALLTKVQIGTGADSAVKIVEVISAHKQVVSGQITYLDLRIAETHCPIGTLNMSQCLLDGTEDPFICEVAVWERPWLNSTKIIDEKSKCAEIEDDTDFNNWNRGLTLSQSINGFEPLGSLPAHLDQSQVALEAFDYVDRGSESKFKGQMINFEVRDVKHNAESNATLVNVDIEYGFTLCLKFPNKKVDDRVCPLDKQRHNYVCSVTVVSTPISTSNLKVNPGVGEEIDCRKKSVVGDVSVPVEAICMGCPQSKSLNDPSIMKAAEFALFEYDRSSDDSSLHTLAKLHKAQTQVVNGIKYYLTMEIAETDCYKPLSAYNMNRTLCNRQLLEDTDICDAVVMEKPWQQYKEVISIKCFDRDDYPASNAGEFAFSSLGKSNFGYSNFGSSFTGNTNTGSSNTGSSNTEFSNFGLSARSDSNINQAGSSISNDKTVSPSIQRSVDLILNEVNRREVDDDLDDDDYDDFDDDGLYKVIRIIEASSSNEASGQVDHIVVEIGETVCTRRSVSANCPLKIGEDGEVCISSVLSGNPGRLLSLKCDDSDDYYRLTRNPIVRPFATMNVPFFTLEPGMTGTSEGTVEQPTNDTTVTDIARFVVDQYNLQNDDDELQRLNSIITSFSRAESGMLIYTLELEIQETLCKKYQPVVDVSNCPVDLSERPEVCQAEVSVIPSAGGRLRGTRNLRKIFCDERRGFYIKKTRRRLGTVDELINSGLTQENTTDDKITRFGKLIADAFDERSDEDSLFVLVKVLKSETEESGLNHRLSVELAETICPKYRRNIEKSRCAIDIGEEHKFCDALVVEMPWNHDQDVRELRCRERDDSLEENDSVEIFYPRIRPSAHSRPRFVRSRFSRWFGSSRSRESIERYYGNRGHRGSSQGRRQYFDRDSDEHNGRRYYGNPQNQRERTSGWNRGHTYYDSRSDERLFYGR